MSNTKYQKLINLEWEKSHFNEIKLKMGTRIFLRLFNLLTTSRLSDWFLHVEHVTSQHSFTLIKSWNSKLYFPLKKWVSHGQDKCWQNEVKLKTYLCEATTTTTTKRFNIFMERIKPFFIVNLSHIYMYCIHMNGTHARMYQIVNEKMPFPVYEIACWYQCYIKFNMLYMKIN